MQSQSFAVPNTFTPEQLTEAQLILNQMAQSTVPLTGSTVGLLQPAVTGIEDVVLLESTTSNFITSALVVIDQVRRQAMEAKFNETINNPRFWANPKRAERLDQALTIPEYDDRSLQQFAISASEELNREAIDFAIASGSVPVKPTKEQIRARAEEKYEAKLAKEAKKKK